MTYPVLGIDAEWLTVNGIRRPIALLQLSSNNGHAALIRLCILQHIPQELRAILEDPNIIKCGVVPEEDAKLLAKDYAVCVSNTLDLRYLAFHAKLRLQREGLAGMSEALLGIQMDKNWRLRCSDWEAPQLNDTQIEYAAKDAFVAIELFKKLTNIIVPCWIFGNKKRQLDEILDFSQRYLDIRYKPILSSDGSVPSSPLKQSKKDGGPNKEFKRFKHTTRQKPLYDNIPMHAPDGELLCNCDESKANWYVSKNLAKIINEDPFTIQLTFEPAGRAVGQVGKYYTIAKINRCVVCGEDDSYLRKNIVPREYRKYFPVVMKDHTSHDVLLLCTQCHQVSNMADLNLRYELADLCDAPIQNGANAKLVEIESLKQMKSAARALYKNGDRIPEKRRKELEAQFLDGFPEGTIVTKDLLLDYLDVDIYKENENYLVHGKKVVEYFSEKGGGIIQLERKWREHFLKKMNPKYLPELWSVDHNIHRLEIRADEGRVEVSDLLLAGLNPSKLTTDPKSTNPSISIISEDDNPTSSNSSYSVASTLKQSTPTEFYSQRTLSPNSQYETAKSDDDTSISLTDFKSIDGTLVTFHPSDLDDDTVYHSDDSDSTLTQPSSSISLELDSD